MGICKSYVFSRKTLNVITCMLLLFVTMLNLTVKIEMSMWRDSVQVCFQDPLIIVFSAETMTEVYMMITVMKSCLKVLCKYFSTSIRLFRN